MWFRKKKNRRSASKKIPARHYTAHRELARSIITERTVHWNQYYGFSYNRIAIKNQKRCWGSCSAQKNLNFNYRIIFLPEVLMDYVIVHELCHLAELNHSKAFWSHVARALPEYHESRRVLRKMQIIPVQGFPSSTYQKLQAAASGDQPASFL